ncbi:MAG: hypothetical protein MHM6MM_001830 [Cercozoa sp. M6MM]
MGHAPPGRLQATEDYTLPEQHVRAHRQQMHFQQRDHVPLEEPRAEYRQHNPQPALQDRHYQRLQLPLAVVSFDCVRSDRAFDYADDTNSDNNESAPKAIQVRVKCHVDNTCVVLAFFGNAAPEATRSVTWPVHRASAAIRGETEDHPLHHSDRDEVVMYHTDALCPVDNHVSESSVLRREFKLPRGSFVLRVPVPCQAVVALVNKTNVWTARGDYAPFTVKATAGDVTLLCYCDLSEGGVKTVGHTVQVRKGDSVETLPIETLFTPGDLCSVCLAATPTVMAEPCRHRMACTECAARLRRQYAPKCPICRQSTTNFIDIEVD